ncbi:hypothetical protein [Methylocystis sp. S23]
MACLFFLQAIAVARAAPVDAGFAGQPVFCAANESPDGPPAPAHHAHGEHCLICAAAGVAQPVRTIVAIMAATIERSAPSPQEWRQRDECPPPVSGWTSSWSSRAPPSFS